MFFSIVIPVYNVAVYLRDCLDSVLGQSFVNFEIVCVNDGSTDDSHEILKEYERRDSRVRIISQENLGLSAARNTGLASATGEYVLFLDSDDWLEPDALQVLSKHLDVEDMLCFNGRRYFEDKGAYEEADVLHPETGISGWDYYCRHALEHRNFAFVCVVLRCYRRRFLLDNGLKFKPGIYHEDNLFTPLVCYYAQRVKVITDVLYAYRVRSSSIMTSRSIKHWQDIIGTANELAAFFKDKDIDRTIIYRALTHYYQSAFSSVGRKEDEVLLPLVDWRLYKAVSRTKLRHRLQYAAMRISPSLYRFVNKHISAML